MEKIVKIKIVLSSKDNCLEIPKIETLADDMIRFFEDRGLTFAMTVSEKMGKKDKKNGKKIR